LRTAIYGVGSRFLEGSGAAPTPGTGLPKQPGKSIASYWG